MCKKNKITRRNLKAIIHDSAHCATIISPTQFINILFLIGPTSWLFLVLETNIRYAPEPWSGLDQWLGPFSSDSRMCEEENRLVVPHLAIKGATLPLRKVHELREFRDIRGAFHVFSAIVARNMRFERWCAPSTTWQTLFNLRFPSVNASELKRLHSHRFREFSPRHVAHRLVISVCRCVRSWPRI